MNRARLFVRPCGNAYELVAIGRPRVQTTDAPKPSPVTFHHFLLALASMRWPF